MSVVSVAESISKQWRAELSLEFSRIDQRSLLSRRRHQGPYLVQKPFYPEGLGCCHVYLIHPPGGIAGGDFVSLDAKLHHGAHVLLTTPAASKFYRSETPSQQIQAFKVGDSATLEWFPQENILFDGTQAQLFTRVELSPGATLMAWDITVLGRPAAKEGFHCARSRQCFEIWQSGRPIWLDRALWQGGSSMLFANWGMAGYTCSASFVASCVNHAAVDLINQNIQTDLAEEMFCVTQLHEILMCRYVGHHAERAKMFFTQVWALLRPLLLNREACRPRIWNT